MTLHPTKIACLLIQIREYLLWFKTENAEGLAAPVAPKHKRSARWTLRATSERRYARTNCRPPVAALLDFVTCSTRHTWLFFFNAGVPPPLRNLGGAHAFQNNNFTSASIQTAGRESVRWFCQLDFVRQIRQQYAIEKRWRSGGGGAFCLVCWFCGVYRWFCWGMF